jgi:outer membrane receptor protein involved in Fe transport
MMLSALMLSLALAQAAVTGIVKDTSGGAVPGASVVVRTSTGTEEQTVTGPDGRFTLDKIPEGPATLIVRAGGFAAHEQPLSGTSLEIVLSPAGLLETVTVTAARTEERLGNIPASVSILDAREIRASPALVADDVLRRLPNFSLFRRSSSLSSHPTTQGVSLRGIGPSGVSRTLVLVDGVPFNDPFGGWVYWTRVPMDSVDRIEVVDGSSSSLYGNYAMGGVINIVSSRPSRRTVELKTLYGNKKTPKADFFGSDVWGKLGVAVEGSVFDTDGFPIVVENERGVVDNNATVTFRNVNVKLDYSPTPDAKVFFRTGYFSEERGNGKIDEVNDTVWKSASGGVRLRLPGESDLQASIFTDFSTFHSTFFAVPATTPPRNTVRLTVDQNVPTDSVGGMVQWSKAFGTSNFFSVGGDWRRVSGDSNEDTYNQLGPIVSPVTASVLALKRVSGGTQRSIGVFVQDVFTPVRKLVITLSARIDAWKNYDAHNLETNIPAGTPGAGNNPNLPDKDDTVGSPRIAALYHVTDQVRVWGDFSMGFRAPTLNELYRSFSVGAVRTNANSLLGPERLKGGELGVSVAPVRNVVLRSTFYDNRVKDPVANVTITPTNPNQLQRQNLGRTRIRGLQTDVEVSVGEYVRVSGGYLFNDAKVREFAANPALVGRYLPQVAKHRGSVQFQYANPRLFNAAIGVQGFGRQFEDDVNVRVVPGESKPGLPGYAIVDFTASRAVGPNVEFFFGIQNVADTQYIAFTVPTTTGSPRLVNGGVRIRWSGR